MTLAVDESTMRKSLEREEKLFSYLDDEEKPSNFRSLSKTTFHYVVYSGREKQHSTGLPHSPAIHRCEGWILRGNIRTLVSVTEANGSVLIEYNQGTVSDADRRSL